jgi:isocitrate dehydrogenase kinase/phosphatase
VADNDVFPQELATFFGIQGAARQAFLDAHSDLFDVDFWHRMQEKHRDSELIDIFPYPRAHRLRKGT